MSAVVLYMQINAVLEQTPAELRQLLPRPPIQNPAAPIDVYAQPSDSVASSKNTAMENSPASLLANQLGEACILSA